MWEGLLPIGSVVVLKNTEQKVMIMGLFPLVGDNGERMCDYSAVIHPYGYVDRDNIFAFDQEDIEEVCQVGYMDDNYFMVYDRANEIYRKVKSGEMTREDLINARPPKPEVEPF